MNNLKITTVQSELVWQDPKLNRAAFDILLSSINNETDLVVLPEMFTTGFTMDSKSYAEEQKGETLVWLRRWAQKLNSSIIGTYIVERNSAFYNSAVCVMPDGKYYAYDKRHLFRMGEEDKFFTPGRKQVEINIKGWKIRPLICYDLRFPVWSRNNTDYDVLIYMANWPKSRSYIWSTLLSARAIENQCYVVGVNRVGKDGNNLDYNGLSSVYDFSGNILYQKIDNPEVYTIELNKEELLSFKKQFPAHIDQDEFSLKFL